jgi:hypothetical protein
MCGYGRPPEALEATLDALGDTPLVTGRIIRPSRTSERMYPSYADHASLLRRCIDGTRGVLIYTLTQLDGRTFHAVGETSRLVSEHEDFFVKNQRDDALASAKGLPAQNCVVFTDGPRRLVILLNTTDKPAQATVTHKNLASGNTVYDFYNGKSLGGKATHQASIPARGAAAFIVAPK